MTDLYTMTIGGAPAVGGGRFDVVNPATETVVATAPDASRSDLEAAVTAARAAFGPWSALSIEERRAHLRAAADVIAAHADEIGAIITAEQGRPLAEAEIEVKGAAFWINATASLDLPVIDQDTPARKIRVRRTPLGVVAAITPWNYPVMSATWKIFPALLAGNAVIAKPSPFTPLSLLRIGELLRGVLPDGVLNIVTGRDELGPWITAHPGIDKISFTGSTATGKQIMASAAGNMKRVTLELGGNDAAIVLPDIDVERTAEKLFWAAFRNTGQVCVAAKRIYVHADVYDAFAHAIARYASTILVGDGMMPGIRLGPVQNHLQYERVKSLMGDSRARGHRFLTGGEIPSGVGYFLPVSIIDNPPDDSRVVREEAFGPIVPLLRYDTVDEVVRRVNDSDFGLAASIWSRDIEAAAALAARLEAGTVWINEVQQMSPFVAFGGHKQSGLGSENGLEGLLEYTNAQTVTIAEAQS